MMEEPGGDECMVNEIPETPENIQVSDRNEQDQEIEPRKVASTDDFVQTKQTESVSKISLVGEGDFQGVYDTRKPSVSGSTKEEILTLEKIIPRVDCPEKIIIIIDLSSDLDTSPFKLVDGSKISPLYMVKRVVEIFVYSKYRIDRYHEYSLVVLHESATWLRNFTNDPKEICNVLDDLNETRSCESCDLGSLFSTIMEKVELPIVSNPEVISPPYIVRSILIYGRSNTVPQISESHEALKKFQQSHYFFLDVLYIHEPASEENKCQTIFETFCELDEKYTSYVFEVQRNATKLHNCMAKLLAHPLQRPFQKDTFYKLQPSGGSNEEDEEEEEEEEE